MVYCTHVQRAEPYHWQYQAGHLSGTAAISFSSVLAAASATCPHAYICREPTGSGPGSALASLLCARPPGWSRTSPSARAVRCSPEWSCVFPHSVHSKTPVCKRSWFRRPGATQSWGAAYLRVHVTCCGSRVRVLMCATSAAISLELHCIERPWMADAKQTSLALSLCVTAAGTATEESCRPRAAPPSPHSLWSLSPEAATSEAANKAGRRLGLLSECTSVHLGRLVRNGQGRSCCRDMA